MSIQNKQIVDVGFVGDFAAMHAAIKTQLLAVTPRNRILQIGNSLSVAQVSGTDAAPVVNLVWRSRPALFGAVVGVEAAAEAALGSISGTTVTHDGGAEAAIRGETAEDAAVVLHHGMVRDPGLTDHTALAAVLGFQLGRYSRRRVGWVPLIHDKVADGLDLSRLTIAAERVRPQALVELAPNPRHHPASGWPSLLQAMSARCGFSRGCSSSRYWPASQ